MIPNLANLKVDAGCGQYDFLAPPPAGCGQTECVGLFRQGLSGQLLFQSGSASGALQLWYPVAVSDNFFVFAATRTVGATISRELAAIPAQGGAAVDVDFWPAGFNQYTGPSAWDGTSLVYLFSYQANQTAPVEVSLRKWVPALGQASVISSNLGTWSVGDLTEKLAADSVGYILPLTTGIWRVPRAGGPAVQLLAVTGLKFVVTQADVIYFSTPSGVSRLSPGQAPVSLWNEAATALTLVDGQPVFLTATGVFQVVGNTVLLRYAQQQFPQFPWLQRLAAGTNGKVYVGQVCGTMDADAPTYGTVELNLSQGTGQWISGSPGWPWSTPIVDFYTAGYNPSALRNSLGFYLSGSW